MSAHIDAIKTWLGTLGLPSSYKIQYGEWKDTGVSTDRYIVIAPDGGLRAEPWFRQPLVRLLIIGCTNESALVTNGTESVTNGIIQAVRALGKIDGLILLECANDAIGPARTTDSRPWYQINLRCLVNY